MIQALVKAAAARTRATLDAPIAAALDAGTAADVTGCFAHAGYLTRQAAREPLSGPRWWASVRRRPSYLGPALLPVISPASACPT